MGDKPRHMYEYLTMFRHQSWFTISYAVERAHVAAVRSYARQSVDRVPVATLARAWTESP